jgi:hypothetical protein
MNDSKNQIDDLFLDDSILINACNSLTGEKVAWSIFLWLMFYGHLTLMWGNKQ